jgi:hypothetical protein
MWYVLELSGRYVLAHVTFRVAVRDLYVRPFTSTEP